MKEFFIAWVLMVIFSGGAWACSCAGEARSDKSIDEIRKEKRNYFLSEFSGAAFVGKIINRQRVNVNWIAETSKGKPASSQMFKYTIRVNEYWIGVKSRTLVVYGEPDVQIYGRSGFSTSCGFKLEKGRTLFFTPKFYKNNLTIQLCDFAGGASSPNGRQAIEFRKIMGEPKTFLRNYPKAPQKN